MHDVLDGIPTLAASDPVTSTRPLLVAVPLYRGAELLPPLAAALGAMADEMRALDATLLLIDDSPDDAPLRVALDAVLPALRRRLRVEIVHNPVNLGFVRSANIALARGRDDGHDVLLLNSDALPRPGAFAEMAAVATLDPMIAAVSPRSDNATICNSPAAAEHRTGGRDRAYAAHRAIERHLPRVSYVPTALGFCLLVRHAMLVEFGLFDEVYGGGYNEENDFIRRCNRRGYRAVLANHAYVHHLGGVSFALSAQTTDTREVANREILLGRYPEYDTVVARWFAGAEYRAQRLLSGLVSDEDGRWRLLFDCSALRPSYNGTFEYIRALLTAFAARHAGDFDIAVLCEQDAFAFHDLDRIVGLRRIDAAAALARPAAAVVRLTQPFSFADLAPLGDYAPVCAVLMLDTIAMDCQQLDDVGLDAVWATMADSIDALGFISTFSRDQFRRRFDVPGRVVEFVSRCSTDVADYRPFADDRTAEQGGDGVLLVGNHYPHKHVREALTALRDAVPDLPVTVLGAEVEPGAGVAAYYAGDQPQALVDDLYRHADVVLFPSHYEGFGLPILHGLARRRPVVARDLPSAREIKALSADGDNLHLAGSTAAMIALAIDPPRWRETPPRAGAAPAGWDAAADAVADAVSRALDRFDFQVCRRRQDRALARRAGSDMNEAARWADGTPATDAGDPLPAHGHGFMLGEMIEVAPQARAGARRAHHGFGFWRRPSVVRLEAVLESRGPDTIAQDLLERLRERPRGTTVTLALDTADARADACVAATILLRCGCAVTRRSRPARAGSWRAVSIVTAGPRCCRGRRTMPISFGTSIARRSAAIPIRRVAATISPNSRPG